MIFYYNGSKFKKKIGGGGEWGAGRGAIVSEFFLQRIQI